MEEMNLRNYAYIGDAVWEIFIREKTVKLTNNSTKLHKITTVNVKASFQAELLHECGNYAVVRIEDMGGKYEIINDGTARILT